MKQDGVELLRYVLEGTNVGAALNGMKVFIGVAVLVVCAGKVFFPELAAVAWGYTTQIFDQWVGMFATVSAGLTVLGIWHKTDKAKRAASGPQEADDAAN